MFNMSELHQATLIMDIAAILIIIGLIVYTSIYRRRGNTCDRIFFCTCLITLVMSGADVFAYLLDGSTVSNAAFWNQISNNIFFVTFEAFCGIIALYMYHRVYKGRRVSALTTGIIMAPAAVMIIMEIVNNFVPFLYYVDPATNAYVEYPLYYTIFIGPLIYGLFVLWTVIRIDKSVIWLYLLLLAVRLFLGGMFRGVSSTALVFAIGLVFIHIHIMGSPFYEEEE